MKNKILWLALSCLMVAALLLAACAPAVEEEEVVVTEEEEEAVTEEEEEVVITEVVAAEEGPQYGGTYTLAAAGWASFEPAIPTNHHLWLPAYEALVSADWSKGPGGTKEIPLNLGSGWVPNEFYAGTLAESWEQPDLTHLVFTIRQGVHFQNKPPVNGREMTAADVVAGFNYLRGNPRSIIFVPPDTPEEDTYRASIDPTDNWKVIVTLPKPSVVEVRRIGSSLPIIPPEIADLDLEDWRNMVGTGPFIIVDAVQGSSATYERNPLYWQFDPFYPENRLPYVDRLRVLVIPDTETQLAALRTGKIERFAVATREQALDLQESNPELLTAVTAPVFPLIIDFQNDKEPFTDVRVRRALAMAIDQPGIYEDFFEGAATLLAAPLAPHAGDAYTPLEELPESTRMLYEYRPEEAKQLLAEAGYPDGFKTEVITYGSSNVDLLSIVQVNWREIGVEAEIKVLEEGTYWGVLLGHTTPQISASAWGSSNPYAPWESKYYTIAGKPHVWNFTQTIDPRMLEGNDTVKATLDPVERTRLMKELNLYAMDQAFDVSLPCPDYYILWQPWLKGYHGEYQVGPIDDMYIGIVKYVWIDQDLKFEITGRR